MIIADQIARQNELIEKVELSGLTLQGFIAIDEARQLFLKFGGQVGIGARLEVSQGGHQIFDALTLVVNQITM